MQLPPAGAASPRLAAPGSSPVPQPGAAAGFEAVMNGVLASDSETSDGTAQQAPDGGAQGKPAADGPRTVTRADKPEASKVAKDTVDAADAASAAGLPDAMGAAGAVAAVAGGLAMAGVATGDTAPQGSGVAVPIMPAGNTQATPAGTRVGAAVSAALPLGSPGQSSTQPGPIPNSPQPTGTLPTGPQPAAALPTSPPSGTLPTSPLPGKPSSNQPAAAPPTGPLPGKPSSNQPAAAPPTGPLPAAARPTSPLPVGLERGVNPTAARSRESGTAVVLPAGRPSTQQDPQRILRQDAPIAAAPGLPAGIQAGVPVVVQAGSPLQQAPSAAPLGMATPTPQADPAKLLPQVSGPLFSLASAAPGAHVMTLKLSPEDLGPLTVRAHIEGAGVRIELFAPGDAGREAVRSILPELRRDLGESGFGASLHLSEHNAPADAGGGGSDPRDRRPMESPAFPWGSDGEPVRLPRTAVVLPRSSTSSLDILV
ncbi:flagellar hook-length control protein FliK [Arthrobacter sp. efr-133-TYG-118]|uniref:flagellar hook-length control protein FliK n=1 Tax=Arthrobacter sp. efr-133-TYG-118 TaxID=3040279 RepID=UPI00254D90BD|nr:flagellar hook-length control protein FliK [Arthrobacter sp. efr-133-TYG-118]